jgi:response regulator RpfG family c-di-GMP phosphodiesterase/streptogramin lyase
MRARSVRLALATAIAVSSGWAPAAVARATEFGGDLPLRQFVQRAWSMEDGLPQSSVTALAQTPDGFLWVGTFGGLARFDGERFRVFDPTSEPPLASGRVLALAVDEAGTLWIGAESGALLRADRDAFSEVHLEVPRPCQIWSLAAAAGGGVWVGTDRGLVRVDAERQRYFNEASGLPDPWVRAVVETAGGDVWVATPRGLARLEGDRFGTVGTPSAVSALALDARGEPLAFGEDGRRLFPQDPRGVPAADELAAIHPTSLLAATDGSLWFAGAGLARFAGGRLRIAPSEAGILPAPVRALLEDREGNVWVGTDGGGLVRFRRGAVATYGAPEGLDAEGLVAVVEDRDGTIWVGSNCAGLWRQRSGLFLEVRRRDGRSFGCVRALEKGANGDLWVGHHAGVTRLAPNGTRQRRELESLPVGAVRGLLEDSEGRLWAATADGVLRRDALGGPFVSTQFPPGAMAPPTGALLEASDGATWVGLEAGAADLGRGGWRLHGVPTGLPALPVRDFHEERPGRIWAATYGAGLALFDGTGWRVFGTRDGLPDGFLSRLLPDGAGALWVTGNRGLFRVSFADLAAVESGRRAAVAPLAVDADDGLRSVEFNGGGSPAGWRARDGRFWLPNLRGLAVLDPERVQAPTHPLPTLVEEVRVDGRSVRPEGRLELPAGTSELDIRFTAIAFTAARTLRFRYQLEGYDAGWLDAGGRREVAYRRLPPGTYRFRAAASRGEGPWGPEAVLDFVARPFLYQRVAFRWGAAVARQLAVAGIWQWGTSHQRVQRRELEREVSLRTAELASEKRLTEEQLVVLGRQERELSALARSLERRVLEQSTRLQETRDVAILTLARIAELRDGATGQHLERIAAYSQRLAELLVAARGLGLDPEFVEQVFRSSPLHDIGKVAIPDAILRKAGPLTADERRIMEGHTTLGGDTLRRIVERYEHHDFLSMAMGIAYSHHERWDGRGYPGGLSGEEIPLPARIVAVVDAYDAITSERPYKPALSHATALERIASDSGSHFDPELAGIFLAHAGDFADLRVRSDQPT